MAAPTTTTTIAETMLRGLEAKGRFKGRVAGRLAVAIVGLATPCAAQQAGSASKPAAVSISAAESEAQRRAEALFYEAERAYEQGRLQDALQGMNESYDLSKAAELLFNLGELERELGHCAQARQRYQEYLMAVPNGRRGDESRAALMQLASGCPEGVVLDKPQTPPPNVAAGSTARYWTPVRIAGGVALGAGLFAAIGAVVSGVLVQNADNNYEILANSGQTWDAARGAALEREGRRSQSAEIALAVSAAALVTGGTVLIVFGGAKTTTKPALSFAASAAGTGAQCSIRF